MSKSGGLQKAAAALAAADGVAHVAFMGLFGWRAFKGGFVMRYLHVLFAVMAGIGLVLSVVGWFLVRQGIGKRIGFWGVGLSSALAGVLLLIASWTSD